MPIRFHRYAGSLQPSIGCFEDLRQAVNVPQTLWVALACPVEGLSCDKKLLALLDQDGNKRIRVGELRAAVAWLEKQLCDYRGIDAASDQLPLSYLSPAAAPLKAAAQMILSASGLAVDAPLTLALVRKSEETLRAKQVTGDGIVAVAGFADPGLAQWVAEILSIFPGVQNRSLEAGISLAHVEQFQQQGQLLLAHQARQAELWVWGEASVGLARQIQALQSQVDAYFVQCRLVAAQPDTLSALRLNLQKIADSLGDATALSHWYGALPIAPPHPDRHLKWQSLLPGPHWEALKALAVALGGEGISEQVWQQYTQQAGAILKWEADFQAMPLSKKPSLCLVPEAELQRIRARCLADLEMRDELAVIEELERLLLYQRWILEFANNFIAMPNLYHPKMQAFFEKGQLFLAGREFRLSVLVQDRASHVKIAEHSSLCLAYVRVEDTKGAYEVVVPITAGTTAGVEVGRRGIFYDREGVEYDATVMQVLLQPVSLWEAMTQPFTRIMAFIEQKASEFAALGDKKLDEGVSAVWNNVVQPTGSTVHLGMVAAGGVALAALSSSLVFVVAQLQQLTLLGFLQTLASMALLVMVPAGLLAALKLRRRNLAVILEGSGWALNDRLLLNSELGRLLTRRPRRPQDALLATQDRVNEALQLRQKEFLDDNVDTAREGTLILVVLGLVLFLAISSNWNTLLQWAGTILEVPSP